MNPYAILLDWADIVRMMVKNYCSNFQGTIVHSLSSPYYYFNRKHYGEQAVCQVNLLLLSFCCGKKVQFSWDTLFASMDRSIRCLERENNELKKKGRLCAFFMWIFHQFTCDSQIVELECAANTKTRTLIAELESTIRFLEEQNIAERQESHSATMQLRLVLELYSFSQSFYY